MIITRPECQCFQEDPERQDRLSAAIGVSVAGSFYITSRTQSVCQKAVEYVALDTIVAIASMSLAMRGIYGAEAVKEFLDKVPEAARARIEQIEREVNGASSN